MRRLRPVLVCLIPVCHPRCDRESYRHGRDDSSATLPSAVVTVSPPTATPIPQDNHHTVESPTVASSSSPAVTPVQTASATRQIGSICLSILGVSTAFVAALVNNVHPSRALTKSSLRARMT